MKTMNMLEKLLYPEGNPAQTVIAFSAGGEILGGYACSPSPTNWKPFTTEAKPEKPRSCTILLPPGLAALRKSPTAKENDKDAQAVLDAETGRTLIRNPELGCGDVRMVSFPQGKIGVQAWLPSELLHLCFEQVEKAGFIPGAVMIPEYNMVSPQPLLFISRINETVNIYFINGQTPLCWQAVPRNGPVLDCAIKAVLDEARELGLSAPEQVLLWDGHEVSVRQGRTDFMTVAAKSATALLPGAQVEQVRGIDGLLARLGSRRESLLARNKTGFRPALTQWLSTPLAPKDLLRLAIPVVCAVLSCLLFFMAVVNLYHDEAEMLEKEASQLKVLAARSDAATQRIRTLSERRRDIIRYTTGKPFVFTMFRDMAKATPKEVKISNLRLGRSGEITINGDAVSEVSLISFLTNLNTSESFDRAELASMSRDKRSQKVKFVITFEFLAWKEFFKQESEAEK